MHLLVAKQIAKQLLLAVFLQKRSIPRTYFALKNVVCGLFIVQRVLSVAKTVDKQLFLQIAIDDNDRYWVATISYIHCIGSQTQILRQLSVPCF